MSAFDGSDVNKITEAEDVQNLSTLTAGISLTVGDLKSDVGAVNEVHSMQDHSSNNNVRHNTNIASLTARQTQHLSAGISFQDPSLKIPQKILDALILDLRFEVPSEIQAVTIPRIVQGKNIIAQAQTGSGKTIAFAIGMLCAVDPTQDSVQAICLTPTRELAIQIIDDAILPLSKYMTDIRSELLVPDEPGKPSRARGSSSNAHIIVGTPGTVKGLIARKYLKNLKQTVKVFVCDEADTMVDQRELGQDTVQIKMSLDEKVQTLFFSATYSDPILSFSRALVKKASVIKLKTNADLLLSNIFQIRMDVNKREHNGGENKKLQILKEIYGFFDIEQSIIFVTTRNEATEVAQMFSNEKYSVSYLHGKLGPDARDEEFRKFREGKTKVLVTTNVLARGVNVPSVDVVVNYDMPSKPGIGPGSESKADPETYVHRMGRCGRFGRQGTAITFLQNAQDDDMLLSIEKYYNYDNSKRMTIDWNPNEIESLADSVRQRSQAAVEPIHLETSIEVHDT